MDVPPLLVRILSAALSNEISKPDAPAVFLPTFEIPQDDILNPTEEPEHRTVAFIALLVMIEHSVATK